MVDQDKNRLQKVKDSMKKRLKLLTDGEPAINGEPSENEELLGVENLTPR